MFKGILIVLSILNYDIFALQCVDHDNNPVDWYVIYKLPLEANSNSLISEGAAYTYITSTDTDGWKLSSVSINDTNSIVGLTLAPLYKNSVDVLYILYNDELPDGSVMFKKGHTKGTILGNANGGIWLVHSVPRFPSIDIGKYYIPHNGFQYGQSFLCISLNLDNLDKVGIPIKYNEPNVYSHNMPDNLKTVLPNLSDILNNVKVKAAPWYHLQFLKSQAGLTFVAFGKGPKFAKELYIDWVAPTLNASLLVETWPNEPGRLPSECDPHFSVYNVRTINIAAASCSFKTTNDHSKWAIVTKDNLVAQWICIGDINRAKPQRHRGGGTVCFTSENAEQAYRGIVADIEPC